MELASRVRLRRKPEDLRFAALVQLRLPLVVTGRQRLCRDPVLDAHDVVRHCGEPWAALPARRLAAIVALDPPVDVGCEIQTLGWVAAARGVD
jgi:hypothetical protein